MKITLEEMKEKYDEGFYKGDPSSIRTNVDTPKDEPKKITYEELEEMVKVALQVWCKHDYTNDFIKTRNLSEALYYLVLTRVAEEGGNPCQPT